VGDGKFVVRSTTGTTEYRVPVGYIGRPNNTPGGARPPAAGDFPPGGEGVADAVEAVRRRVPLVRSARTASSRW